MAKQRDPIEVVLLRAIRDLDATYCSMEKFLTGSSEDVTREGALGSDGTLPSLCDLAEGVAYLARDVSGMFRDIRQQLATPPPEIGSKTRAQD